MHWSIAREQHWFLRYADECYAVTRFCYFAFMQNVVFRTAHHSLEYYLKAALAAELSLSRLTTLATV